MSILQKFVHHVSNLKIIFFMYWEARAEHIAHDNQVSLHIIDCNPVHGQVLW